MHEIIGTAILSVLLMMPLQLSAATYRWVDSSGGIHFTDDPSNIPARYRPRATELSEQPQNPAPVIMESAPSTERTAMKRYSSSMRSKDSASQLRGAEKRPLPPQTRGPGKFKRHGYNGRKKGLERSYQSLTEGQSSARKAQNRVEEELRKTRQNLDNSQLPARRAQERIEEDIRRTRQGIK
jgi:hypothetical protein